MSYLGYKNSVFRKHMRERREEVEKERKRNAKRMKQLYKATLAHVVIAVMLIALYSLVYITSAKADTIKVGEGPFVMAVSYTQSYDDLEYVANFMNCDDAEKYFYKNCTSAPIMMCQLENALHMPMNHETRNTFSKFDFEVDDSQSCGFVKTQKGYNTFIEE